MWEPGAILLQIVLVRLFRLLLHPLLRSCQAVPSFVSPHASFLGCSAFCFTPCFVLVHLLQGRCLVIPVDHGHFFLTSLVTLHHVLGKSQIYCSAGQKFGGKKLTKKSKSKSNLAKHAKLYSRLLHAKLRNLRYLSSLSSGYLTFCVSQRVAKRDSPAHSATYCC